MPSAPETALLDVVSRLHDPGAGVHAHRCEGSPTDAVVWSASEITVRVAARGADEIWVLAGSALLLRLVADSEGGFEDLEAVIRGILGGRAREVLSVREGRCTASGYVVQSSTGGMYAGGLSSEEGNATLPLVGCLSSSPDGL